jgi:hypothetical protein
MNESPSLLRAPPMDNWTTTSMAPPVPLTADGIAELKAKLGPMPRDVFLYPGPMDRFLADLAASGVEIRGPEVAPQGLYLTDLHSIGSLKCWEVSGLECWEVDGQVWIAGSYRDFRDARDGKIPVKLLRPGPG